jgi:DNA-directed RNA polymerase specialized sigma24 family protein
MPMTGAQSDDDLGSSPARAKGLRQSERPPVVVSGTVTVPPPAGGVPPEAVQAFLARSATRGTVRAIVSAVIPKADVEAVVERTMVEATEAANHSAPESYGALHAWVGGVARRVVADYVARRARRARSLGGKASLRVVGGREARGGAPEVPVDRRADDPIDNGGPPRRWLERQVTQNARDRETFSILLEHVLQGRPYTRIAAERGTTPLAVSARIFEFRKRYAQRYERRWLRLTVWTAVAIAVAIVAIAASWITRPRPNGPVEHDRTSIPPPR